MSSKLSDIFINVAIIIGVCLFIFIIVGAIYLSIFDKDLKDKLESNSEIIAICDLNSTKFNIDKIILNCKLN